LMARFTRDQAGANEVDAVAAEIAARKKDPSSAVEELLARFSH
jgi:hypothetical protein